MKISISERHMPESKALNDYALSKIESLSRYFDGIISVNVVMDVEKERHIIDLVAHLIRGKVVKAREESTNMYASIDEAVAELKTQLKKYKERLRDKRPARRIAAQARRHASAKDDSQSEDAIAYSKLYLRKPMTVEEARLQLESYHKDFLVFIDADSRDLNILHRRQDGQYELLQLVY
ncbi:ribosome-associated translation inhibitor RaiA [Candidatus Acetothermia bacterium]|jgi:putative sigma-54 modulation protein|nr:ribosome-associated translation inhibitor RaiA [Candidatus Acetothermia bacterium]MCI2431291.1 ribosome-associated translation inhibitor RaiA [Candidatus Acetothermia bacterium]MCI2436252.1 ribosome-associated translation inhibitor RaiA [Candidatus Acetothermia bacterium]